MSKNISPRWQNPNKPIPPKVVDPAATPVKAKAKPGRNYIGDAVAAIAAGPAGTSIDRQAASGLLGAVIIAQALDRFGEKLIDAAAVSQYRRTP